MTIKLFDLVPGIAYEYRDPITGEKKIKRNPYTEVEISPTGTEPLVGRKVRIIG